jgi:hypothetical protein
VKHHGWAAVARRLLIVAAVVVCAGASSLRAGPASPPETGQVNWTSTATAGPVTGRIIVPPARRAPQAGSAEPVPLATVVYLKNLSIPRVGRELDERILADLLKDGHLILEIDYARHPKALAPGLRADVLRLRREIADRKLLAGYAIDLACLFILPEGFRIKRDVEFCRDGKRIFAMDIMYPADVAKAVPALMEITCDNVNRMGNGSLLFCHDTLLEGGMFAGFAVAMIDHPVPPPYKGIDDPMPDVVFRLKAAVRTLRAEGKQLGLNGRIGAMGFSRGSNMAALLATTGGLAELEGECGGYRGVSSYVQAALAHGGRFDFARLRPDDPMLARFAKAWGPRESNAARWDSHGAAHYIRSGNVAPMFLNTSNTESPEFRDQAAVLAAWMKAAGVEHVYVEDADSRGHRVSTDPKTLEAIYAFFAKHLAE